MMPECNSCKTVVASIFKERLPAIPGAKETLRLPSPLCRLRFWLFLFAEGSVYDVQLYSKVMTEIL